MRQGNDVGTQYRSAIYTYGPEQQRAAEASRDLYQKELTKARYGRDHHRDPARAAQFYYAEDYHQQYLAKNPVGLLRHRRYRRRLLHRAHRESLSVLGSR